MSRINHDHNSHETVRSGIEETDPVCGMKVSKDSKFHTRHAGQIFLAIFIARLVGLYIAQQLRKDTALK